MEFPNPGFYRHYKFDAAKDTYKYLYEVVGSARNTEDETFSVLYRPLYKNDFLSGAQYFSRPLDNFCEQISPTTKRFTSIEDPVVIKELEDIRKTMYGQ
jgi:hypothetical protein